MLSTKSNKILWNNGQRDMIKSAANNRTKKEAQNGTLMWWDVDDADDVALSRWWFYVLSFLTDGLLLI